MAINNLLKEKDPNFFRVVESKKSSIDDRRIKFWWNDDEVDWCQVEATNGSGGILSLWKKSEFANTVVVIG